MGARGPAPTSKAELAARGSWRAEDRPDDLTLPVAAPAPPKGMHAEGKKLWQHIVGLLHPKGAITEADTPALTVLCELWAEDRELASMLKKTMAGSMDWKRVRNARSDGRKQMKDLFAKFGLTPADRPRVKVQSEKPAQNDKSRYFKPRLAG